MWTFVDLLVCMQRPATAYQVPTFCARQYGRQIEATKELAWLARDTASGDVEADSTKIRAEELFAHRPGSPDAPVGNTAIRVEARFASQRAAGTDGLPTRQD